MEFIISSVETNTIISAFYSKADIFVCRNPFIFFELPSDLTHFVFVSLAVSLSLPFSSLVNSGYMGAASCIILSNFGSAWGTWKAGVGVCKMGTIYPEGVIKNIVPIVMAGVLGI